MRRCVLALLLWPVLAWGQIPAAAEMYREDMLKSAWDVFGPGAPTATLAAQVHQESAWRPQARSHVGAMGLTQFMPLTAEDMAKRFPGACAPADPFDSGWAFRCRDRYMKSLLDAVDGRTEQDDWAFALSSYNGGLGWLRRDARLCIAEELPCRGDECDARRWFGNVERFSSRAGWAFRENRGYVIRIFGIDDRYEVAGWGRQVE